MKQIIVNILIIGAVSSASTGLLFLFSAIALNNWELIIINNKDSMDMLYNCILLVTGGGYLLIIALVIELKLLKLWEVK